MAGLLWLVWLLPALPLAGFATLTLWGSRLPRRLVAALGVGSVVASAVAAIIVGAGLLSVPPAQRVYVQTLWTWMRVDGFAPGISLYLDPLSLVMALVATIIGALIHIYSAQFMEGDRDYGRFFAAMNLFVASFLILVLADNLLLLLLGWEGVGLCSYLLIGFWYEEPANCRAAEKAFIVTRVGDTAFTIGLFLLFAELHTLRIQDVMRAASAGWPAGSALPTAVALLFLGGAVGKSAQLPLQTWLPDAMAGPTPVSALIHAATMVTAGVYLIARMHVIFSLAPDVMVLVSIIGAATLLMAGLSALVQRDIKRVLAYSTMSQIGYMFLALGVGAWSAAIFHLVTHACFKSLLFLAAGSVIHALDDEHDLFRMGGLRTQLPVTFWTFLVGGAALAGFPLVTSGFYSKDLILWETWSAPRGAVVLWAAAMLGVLLTGLYIFRLIFLAFFGEARRTVHRRPGLLMTAPMVVLAVLSVTVGFLDIPATLGNLPLFTRFLRPALPTPPAALAQVGALGLLELLSAAAALIGILVAYLWISGRRRRGAALEGVPGLPASVGGLWRENWGFDWLYQHALVGPYRWLAASNREDVVDWPFMGLAQTFALGHQSVRQSQSGRLRVYLAVMATSVVIAVGVVVVVMM